MVSDKDFDGIKALAEATVANVKKIHQLEEKVKEQARYIEKITQSLEQIVLAFNEMHEMVDSIKKRLARLLT